MTKHDLIFSRLPRRRLARHAAFWIVWCVSYLLFIHFPVRSFIGWSLSDATSANMQKIGVFCFVLKTLLFNTILAVVIPQAVFIYALLYWQLPLFFYKKKRRFITVCITFSLLLLYFTLAAVFKTSVPLGNYVFGITREVELGSTISDYIVGATIDLLTSFPMVTGIALMIKLMKRWWLKQKEAQQLAYEKTAAELQLLKAQVHPHFLFNTLNNIYFFALTASPKAPEMIRKLSGLLHYIMNECNGPLVSLQKEITMIRDYTALEKIRYGEQIEMHINIQEEGAEKLIAPLLLIPFVENSFKHGTSKMLAHPWVKLCITIEKNWLHFSIVNSRPTEMEPQARKGNIGLKNVKKRLELLYPGTHELNIICKPESFAVYLKVQLQEASAPLVNKGLKASAYAMA